uniref:Dynein light chain roadblock-type 2 n=1 Tax=Labrus bergylta TaxID=56723 RepID=A0A3Q3F3Y1_9LABR
IGIIVVNAEGIPIRSTLDNSNTRRYAEPLRQIAMMARSTVRDIDPQNDLRFLRIRTKDYQILVAVGEHDSKIGSVELMITHILLSLKNSCKLKEEHVLLSCCYFLYFSAENDFLLITIQMPSK